MEDFAAVLFEAISVDYSNSREMQVSEEYFLPLIWYLGQLVFLLPSCSVSFMLGTLTLGQLDD